MGTTRQRESGMSHLVEAATALTALVDVPQAPMSMVHDSSSETVVSDDDDCRRTKSESELRKRETFPQKLMEILTDQSLSDIVSWLPHGRSFVVVRPDILTAKVLPKYLPPVDSRASTKYPSFTRKLNRWGFRQATKGPDTGAFHHLLFRRDNPSLCLQMECQKSRERQSAHKRNLPPKKRDLVGGSLGNSNSVFGSSVVSAASVSADDRSVVSFGNSTVFSAFSSQDFSGVPPTAILSARLEDAYGGPQISNDTAFVAKTLRQRDTNEVARVAKAMLYDAYIKVLKDAQAQVP